MFTFSKAKTDRKSGDQGKSRFRKRRRPKQFSLFERQSLSYGGELMKKRKGRSGPRPLSTRDPIHLVLRSSQAKGSWSFRLPKNRRRIHAIVKRLCTKYSIKLRSYANVGNHLHFEILLSLLQTYAAFIRELTGAIAVIVTGASRWNKGAGAQVAGDQSDCRRIVNRIQIGTDQSVKPVGQKLKFWDYRPFTRLVQGYRARQRLRNYIEVNRWEGFGASRAAARIFVNDGYFVGDPCDVNSACGPYYYEFDGS